MERATSENFRSPWALGRFFLTTIAGLGLDLWTKHWAFQSLALGAPAIGRDGYIHVESASRIIIPDWLQLTLTCNQGAVFGIGQGNRWLFVVISLAAIAFLTYLFASSGRQRFYQFLLGLLLAGVLGNMFDRVTLGYVRDMIFVLPGWPKIFPWIFNVADIMLCCGVGMMLVYSVFRRPPVRSERGFDVMTRPPNSGRGDA